MGPYFRKGNEAAGSGKEHESIESGRALPVSQERTEGRGPDAR